VYESFFGLRERPFTLTANPRFLLLTPTHREALSNLEYGIESGGITLLVGESGTGKTTLLRKALTARVPEGAPASTTVYINNPTLTRAEFYDLLATEFRLGAEAGHSKPRFLANLEHMVLQQRRAGGHVALIIDEAQSLPLELLEEIRLLANMETPTEKLLSLIVAGQPELARRINHPELRQFKQRVSLRCALAPLSIKETAAYIAARVRLAGGDAAEMFSREAVLAIFHYSAGVPRLINVVCENALVTAFGDGRTQVDDAIVTRVAHDFDLSRDEPPANVTTFPSGAAARSGRWPTLVANRLSRALREVR
jgi:general secretion pathway protein A